ncbi:hypothetical protein [Nocardiopsis sp. CA-288880]|uniref:hypothetical protein n=1 Tax=Nocardiopsis sp. CA-288880 TaxID=3239995 RepID=UPI003D9A0741
MIALPPPVTWRIEDTSVKNWPALSFRRPWETERHTISALRPDQVRADLRALESIERNHPDWYVGFLFPAIPVERLDGFWAQQPMENVVVHAETPRELVSRIRAARTEYGL